MRQGLDAGMQLGLQGSLLVIETNFCIITISVTIRV